MGRLSSEWWCICPRPHSSQWRLKIWTRNTFHFLPGLKRTGRGAEVHSRASSKHDRHPSRFQELEPYSTFWGQNSVLPCGHPGGKDLPRASLHPVILPARMSQVPRARPLLPAHPFTSTPAVISLVPRHCHLFSGGFSLCRNTDVPYLGS